MDWKEVKLDDVCLKITDGSHFSPREETSGRIMLSSKDMRDNDFDYSDVKYISEEDYQQLVRNDCKPLKNDILIIKDGNSYLKHIFLCKEEREQVVLSSIAIVRPNPNQVLPEFLTYALKSPSVKNAMALFLSGAAIPRIILDDFKKVKVKLPTIEIQCRIAETLSRYDALIENYQRQISLLEAMAQNLYREWFVRGRFHSEDKSFGEWQVKSLGEIARDRRQIVNVEAVPANTKYIGLEHLSIKSVVIRNYGTIEEVESDKLIFEANDILFGKIRPYLHKVCLSHFAGVCSSDTIVIQPVIENALGFVLFTVFDNHFIEFADKISNGTKMPRAEWNVLKTYKIAVPPANVLEHFESKVNPILRKMGNLQTQIFLLQSTRDKLLPRLMSGQLEVHS